MVRDRLLKLCHFLSDFKFWDVGLYIEPNDCDRRRFVRIFAFRAPRKAARSGKCWLEWEIGEVYPALSPLVPNDRAPNDAPLHEAELFLLGMLNLHQVHGTSVLHVDLAVNRSVSLNAGGALLFNPVAADPQSVVCTKALSPRSASAVDGWTVGLGMT